MSTDRSVLVLHFSVSNPDSVHGPFGHLSLMVAADGRIQGVLEQTTLFGLGARTRYQVSGTLVPSAKGWVGELTGWGVCRVAGRAATRVDEVFALGLDGDHATGTLGVTPFRLRLHRVEH